MRIAVEIRIAGDEAEVDFTGSDPQAAGPVNANRAILARRDRIRFPLPAAGAGPVHIRTAAADSRHREARIGRLGRTPAAMAAGNVETSQRITDVLLGALAQVLPDRIPAASSGTMNNLSFGGYDRSRGRPFAYYETIAGGMGAGPEHDGQSATHTHMTNSWNTPVEALEHQLPLRIRQYSIRRESGGQGARAAATESCASGSFWNRAKVTLLSDRRARGPYGLHGGSARHSQARNTLIRRGKRTTMPAKTEFLAEPGDVFRIETPGRRWTRPSSMMRSCTPSVPLSKLSSNIQCCWCSSVRLSALPRRFY